MQKLFRRDEIGMIINPNAKRARKSIVKSKLFWSDFLDESKAIVTPDIPAIVPALEALKAQNIRVLAIYGGDGTFQKTLTAALKVWEPESLPAILALKGGTANALIKNMGIEGVDWLPGISKDDLKSSLYMTKIFFGTTLFSFVNKNEVIRINAKVVPARPKKVTSSLLFFMTGTLIVYYVI